jgi:hypothetical protein
MLALVEVFFEDVATIRDPDRHSCGEFHRWSAAVDHRRCLGSLFFRSLPSSTDEYLNEEGPALLGHINKTR